MEEGVSFGPKNATPSQVVIKVRTGAEKRSFFGSLKRNLLLREGIESNPGPVTIGETLSWYRNSCQNGKLAESEIKIESVKFFKLSGDDLNRNKKMFKLALEKLVRKDANIQKTLLREIKKLHHKGQGKAGAAFHEIPPTDFFPDISDVNERKMMFFKQCKEELKLSQKYLTWVDKEFKLFSSHNTASPTKELEEGTLTLTRERSSGRNICMIR